MGECECDSHLCRADWPETRVHLHHLSEGLHSCRARGGEKTDSSSSYYQHQSVVRQEIMHVFGSISISLQPMSYKLESEISISTDNDSEV